MKHVMQLHNAVQRLDETFPAILSGLVNLHEIGKAQPQGSVKIRIVELVRDDYQNYISELGEIIKRMAFLNTNLSRLIDAAKKILEENKA